MSSFAISSQRRSAPTAAAVSASAIALLALLGLPAAGSAGAAELTVSQTTMTVAHVTVSSPKPYAAVKRELEARLGKLDEHIRQLAREGKHDELRAALEKVAGSDGLVWHYTGTHGEWLIMKGGQVKPVTEYFIGNILSAVEMTSVNYASGLYAPLRIVLYENAQGGSSIEYDQPSTQLSQFHSPQIDAVGRTLDERLAKLVAAVEQ
ncbi:DUF302 domain-containing protein [Rugamonas sp.]|uniref:DUF302 domain-containing protein n=1 Tax=Rugamonas sp. TaxID=1926287 RepID=UPI0025D5E878|nr:DUF302 domain-containing protein [Rugamonas sp.]